MTMTEALAQISSLVTTAWSTISTNEVMMVMFCGSLMGIGFAIIQKAKHAAMN